MRSHAPGSLRQPAGTIVLDTRHGVRARPWGTHPGLAHLVVADHTWSPPADRIRTWLDTLAAAGFSTVRTGALDADAAHVFRASGFEIEQTLALLRTDPRRRQPRRSTRSSSLSPSTDIRTVDIDHDLSPLVAIDRAAFGVDWRIDEDGIIDACVATPAHRLRMVDGCAFAVTGRAGRAGFLQRLAVHPDHHRHGLGRALVLDSLQWLRRRRVHTAMVNTHTDNVAALSLYESLGFERLPSLLHVLTRPLARTGGGA